MMLFANTRRATNVSLTIAMLLILALATSCGGGALAGNNGNSGNGGNGGHTNPPPPPPTPATSVTLTPTSSTIFAGQTVTFKATVNGTPDQTLTWSVNGIVGGNSTVGTINIYGLYQAPAAMPNPNQVTIKAVSTTNANASASGSVTIDNAIPKIIAVTPDSFATTASFTITINGTGFVNGAKVNWGSTVLPTTFVSNTQLTATGTQSIKVRSVAVSVDNPDPGRSRSNYFYVFTDPASVVSKATAARLLHQMSWGPTTNTITVVRSSNTLKDYLNGQFATPQFNCYPAPSKDDTVTTIEQRFFICAIVREDQLRQRVAFSLSQIMVASSNKVSDPTAITMWQNMFEKDAFGNYYDLLRDVTLSPVMGNYLDMLNNDKPDPATGTSANENYAREVLQLFSIGLEQLNPDGTMQLDGSGNTIPTYSQDTITNFARVFTGWTYPGGSFGGSPKYTGPMVPIESHHDTGSKTLLNGFVISAGGTAQSDMDAALQNIFNHPNVGPFICKQLIQHMVTSNPSPEYVGRVVAVFNNNGASVRGDLKAVVTAILLDPEARRGDDPTQIQPNDGHLKEPLLLMTNLLRAMNGATSGVGYSTYAINMKQQPFNSPSVFNFYHPTFVIPGTNFFGPEFELFNSSTTITRVNFINDAVFGTLGKATTIDLSYYILLAPNPDQLVDRLNEIMMNGAMSAKMHSEIINAISGISDSTNRTKTAIYLIASSSQYQVQH
jgi:uncharacterized protein (DUF1800 family)